MSHPVAPTARTRTARRARFVPLVLAAALLVPACGSDSDGDGAAKGGDRSTTTEKPAPTAPTSADDGKVVEVHAMDFAFEGLPKSVEAGTKLTFANHAAEELHEMVVIKLPDSEKRPVDELLELPESELGSLMQSEPAMVLIAKPGGEQINAVGDGTLEEKGRYLVMCSIPTGADADAMLAAFEKGEEPPAADGAPHFVNGMQAELIVT